MKYIFLILSALAAGQNLTLSASKATLAPGESATLTWTLAGQSTPVIAALQADQPIVAGLTVTGRVVGAAGSAATKSLTCSTTGRCVLVGIGTTAMANGVIATATITASATALPGPVTLQLTNPLAVTGAGALTPLTPGPELTITITNKLDLNGDGQVTIQDITISTLQLLTGTCPPGGDVNSDGLCDLRDLQAIAAQAR